MHIVVLDGYTLNPGDLSWHELQQVGTCTIYDRTPPSQIIERAHTAEIVLTNKTVLQRETLAQLPQLRYIGVLATGVNVVDIAAARERGIPVTNVPSYGPQAVAQHVFALLLELTRQVGRHAHSVQAGKWSQQPDFCYWETPQIDLEGLTMGIVGLGAIGQRTAQLAQAFGMTVLAYQRHPQAMNGVRWVSLETLLQCSDVISLHCPLTESTEHLINQTRLQQMKKSAFLINTSRGPLVDEAALAAALQQGEIAGAGVDVLTQEPPAANNPLFSAPHCLITPHIAWATQKARSRLMQIAVANIKQFLQGQAQNVVNSV